MMWKNMSTIEWDNTPPKRKPLHPEAPEAGEEVMYVDLSREKLEQMYSGKTEE